ncbi:MAG: hypothetical protein GY849_02435 [Deltaproteobacteria bacterium]|nr:hypothetical protein [Deltaproteobacteria bacterium]
MANTVKNISLLTVRKNPLNKPPLKIYNISFLVGASPYLDDMTISTKKNNSANTGFNDYGYNLVPPDNIQVKSYISENDYDGVIQTISTVAEISGTVDGDGVLTDYKLTV